MAVHGGEWPSRLDVQALLESGWRPTPFREFVLKIHSRCNLACDYCYMYESPDQGWKTQPRRMARTTVDLAVSRIAEHAHAHRLPALTVVLHGGEPLLAGVEHLRHTVTALRAALPDTRVAVQVQTNGTLLDPVFLDLFAALDVRVGVSLDGDAWAHDRHRTRRDGGGSHADVLRGLDLLTSPRYRPLFGGLLATIDLANDPVVTYEALLAHGPPEIDFLLPHGTWDLPPPGRPPDLSTPYGDWLVKVFDRWYGAPVRETRIRLFGEILHLLLGRPSRSETIGLSPVAVVVVETNGRIEQVDSLKSAFDGASRTPLHLARDSFDDALLVPGVAARQIGARALSPACLSCDLHRVCGAGLYPHRHRSGTGFHNPSVYCPDLYRLITHTHQTLTTSLTTLRSPP
ncbi:FxsB family radical SAM/SPASM domain protein [Actinocorallia sp. API 0066]|uniref:FxsB family cyclophane-forming radical SAM/SPASM peptide maturase n=1 Tax=Actinocorallia sp. API 0066 TaxID=2896846 RepID=UPI001E373905|nr:FxsB family cyclophane-forming radical SAM/SPASM peptide maturase [Actinocorallia sp. API 0066]MCD0452585.1 FxsB family radical SAM/SPASM domain protein [Actinocorallia sp. API 0066]